jgi:hypothetical protein
MLAALASERERGHRRNLVVAPTGVGKTMVAAFDYARTATRPRLLFVAHREQLLDQSLSTFRQVLRDGSFGEKLVGGIHDDVDLRATSASKECRPIRPCSRPRSPNRFRSRCAASSRCSGSNQTVLRLSSRSGRGPMPTILRVDGFEFVVHLNDHPPANVHAFTADGECRIVIEPEVRLDRFWRMNERDARRATRIAREHRAMLLSEWRRIHGQQE